MSTFCPFRGGASAASSAASVVEADSLLSPESKSGKVKLTKKKKFNSLRSTSIIRYDLLVVGTHRSGSLHLVKELPDPPSGSAPVSPRPVKEKEKKTWRSKKSPRSRPAGNTLTVEQSLSDRLAELSVEGDGRPRSMRQEYEQYIASETEEAAGRCGPSVEKALQMKDRKFMVSCSFALEAPRDMLNLLSTNGILFVFSRFFCEDFDRIVTSIARIRKESSLRSMPLMLVAMSLDPAEEDSDAMQPVSRDYIHRMSKQYDVPVFLISRDNLHELANTAVAALVRSMDFRLVYESRWGSVSSCLRDPLSVAVRDGAHKRVLELLATGPALNRGHKLVDGWNALHVACWTGNYDVAFAILKRHPDAVNSVNTDLWTPLHVAARTGHLPLVRLLVDRGANVNAVDSDGFTADDTNSRQAKELLHIRERSNDLNRTANLRFDLRKEETPLYLLIDNTKLQCIPREVYAEQFHLIQHLNVSHNTIPEIPAELVAQLTQLRSLVVSHNELSSLPPNIGALSQLELFDCSFNKLQSLPPSIGDLENVRELVLSNNMLNGLPSEVVHLHNTLVLLDVSDNPFEAIPSEVIPERFSVLPSDQENLFSYLRSVRQGQEPLLRIPAVVVGSAGSGKSALIHALSSERVVSTMLLKDMLEESAGSELIHITSLEQTMEIREKEMDVQLDFVDFSSYDSLSHTHPYFLLHRAVHIVCFNVKDRDLSEVAFWLNSIHHFAQGAPIVVVGTHVDDEAVTEEYIGELEGRFREEVQIGRFKSALGAKSVKGVHYVSLSRKKRNVPELRSALLDVSCKSLLGRAVPIPWHSLRTVIDELRPSTAFISWDRFVTLAAGVSVDEEDAKQAAEFLQSVGCLCAFIPRPGASEDTKPLVVLQMQLIQRATLPLFSQQFKEERADGKATWDEITAAWAANEIPQAIFESLAGLLESYDVMYRISQLGEETSRSYLIPNLLPEEMVSLGDQWKAQPGTATSPRGAKSESNFPLQLGRMYTFESMPLGFCARLFIRSLHLPNVECVACWRYGMFVSMRGSRSLLYYNPSKYQLKILIRGPQEDYYGAELLQVLTESVDTIRESWYSRLQVYVKAICYHCTAEGSSNPTLFPFSDCTSALVNGQTKLKCKGSWNVKLAALCPDLAFLDLGDITFQHKDVDIHQLLGTGAFGTVSKVKLDGEEYAMKTLEVASTEQHSPRMSPSGSLGDAPGADVVTGAFCEFLHESRIMNAMNHPNVVQLSGICIRPVAVLMELLPMGDLYHLIDTGEHETDGGALARVAMAREKLQEWDLKLLIALDIARGMEHMHSLSPPIAHRDVRSPNIFVLTLQTNAPVRVKVGDFGLARRPSPTLSGGEFNQNWLAPEVMRGEEYDHRMDIYGFAIICWELATLQRPFQEYDEMFAGKPQQMFRAAVINGMRPSLPDQCAFPRFLSLMARCWNGVAAQRPPFAEVVRELEDLLTEAGITYPVAMQSKKRKRVARTRSGDERVAALLDETVIASFDNVKMVTLRQRLPCKHPHTINDLCFVPSTGDVWACCNEGTIRIWHNDDQGVVRVLNDINESKVDRVFCAIALEHVVVAGADEGLILVMNMKGDVKRRIKSKESKHEKDVRALLVVHPPKSQVVLDGQAPRLWSASVDGVINIWRSAPKAAKNLKIHSTVRIATKKEERGVFCMAQFHDNVALGLSDGTMMMLSWEGEILAIWKAHTSSVYRVVSTNRHIWSCARRDEVIKVWDGEHESAVMELCGHQAQVMSLLYAHGIVWSGAFDGGETALILWDPETFHALQLANCDKNGKPVHTDGVKCLTLANQEVWAGGSQNDPRIAIWSLNMGGSTPR